MNPHEESSSDKDNTAEISETLHVYHPECMDTGVEVMVCMHPVCLAHASAGDVKIAIHKAGLKNACRYGFIASLLFLF